ncbi:hypothetical protein SDC9_143821 [bioreactor metagenome]|uniref:Uncharacterized protein n=1 Tax=bioreactor metagenome TaxID=1076179 RepID=A0A645E576_9ZZZZ
MLMGAVQCAKSTLLSINSTDDGFAIKEMLLQISFARIMLHSDGISPSQPHMVPSSFKSASARQAVVLQLVKKSKHLIVNASILFSKTILLSTL